MATQTGSFMKATFTPAASLTLLPWISRTDIIVKDDGGMAVLETNTIPGMTPTSLVPRALNAAGIGFGQFLDILIAGAQNETQ